MDQDNKRNGNSNDTYHSKSTQYREKRKKQ